MAATFANREYIARGAWNLMYVEVTLDSSYLTGGEAITAKDLGFSVIRAIWVDDTVGGYPVVTTRSSDTSWTFKFFAFSSSSNTATELVSGKDLSTVVLRCLVLGR